ncbi:MAG TPA: hypothetical protein VE155_15990, partial [Pseudonocardiaceae bacterium]|nr:hypothetical protein [Pseudonocardiaceae bacterium]
MVAAVISSAGREHDTVQVLKRMSTFQLGFLLFGHSPHQGFIISGPETLGTEQHHITTNAALNSDKV